MYLFFLLLSWVNSQEECRSSMFSSVAECFQTNEGWDCTECTVLSINVEGRPWTLQDTPLVGAEMFIFRGVKSLLCCTLSRNCHNKMFTLGFWKWITAANLHPVLCKEKDRSDSPWLKLCAWDPWFTTSPFRTSCAYNTCLCLSFPDIKYSPSHSRAVTRYTSGNSPKTFSDATFSMARTVWHTAVLVSALLCQFFFIGVFCVIVVDCKSLYDK